MRLAIPAICAALLALAGVGARADTPDLAGGAVPMQEASGSLGELLFGTGPKPPEAIPPEHAFALAVSAHSHVLALRFDVHDCCYLYRDKLRFEVLDPDGRPLAQRPRLGEVRLPPGEKTRDPYFGESAVYRRNLEVRLPLLELPANAAFALEVTYQGCSEQGVVLCYEPLTRRIRLRSTGNRLIVESLGPPHPAS